MQQFLYFFPLPQGQGSLRPTLGPERRTGFFRGGWTVPLVFSTSVTFRSRTVT